MQNAELWRQFEGQWVDSSLRLVKVLGVGGYGGVFSAEHLVEGTLIRQVAIKLLFPGSDAVEKQLAELVAASSLRHAHLLTCFHAGSTTFPQGKVLFLVMELAEFTLQSQLAGGQLPINEVSGVVESLAKALVFLHGQKPICVHRDVKPGNVLRVQGVWKVGDFGSLRNSRAANKSHGPSPGDHAIHAAGEF